MIGNEQQVVGDFTECISHPVDDATATDALQSLRQAAVPGCRATGENDAGAGESH